MLGGHISKLDTMFPSAYILKEVAKPMQDFALASSWNAVDEQGQWFGTKLVVVAQFLFALENTATYDFANTRLLLCVRLWSWAPGVFLQTMLKEMFHPSICFTSETAFVE